MPIDVLKRHAPNVLGWRTKRRILVIESDDWGSVRTPSRSVLERLKASRAGIRVNRFDEFDCLESGHDLEALAETLSSAETATGSKPVLTTNMVMHNPDFEAITETDYSAYASKSLFASYDEAHGTDLRPVWETLIATGVMRPQFHAREHLNVSLWMHDLRIGLPATREAFQLGASGHMQDTSSAHHGHYLAAYHATSAQDLHDKAARLLDGLSWFEREFGTASETMIPCNYVWPTALTATAARAGVRGIQGSPVEHVPDIDHGGLLKSRRRWFQRASPSLPARIVRNVTFEPYAHPTRDHVSHALRQVATAFAWSKPAVISTHRINFVGGLDVHHRDRNLADLKRLLSTVTVTWPDVTFMSSPELLRLMQHRG